MQKQMEMGFYYFSGKWGKGRRDGLESQKWVKRRPMDYYWNLCLAGSNNWA